MANPNSEARLGYGTKLLMGDGGSPEEFAEMGEVGDFEEGDSIELVEVTNHQSPNNRREYIAGLKDGAEMSFPVNYIPADPTHDRSTGIRGKIGEVVTWRIEAPGETEGYEFYALVMGITRSFPVQGVMQMTVNLKKTGADSYYPVTP
jgi:hypothetical protein